MHEKDNYLKTAELSTEQNCNMIDGVPNNTPIPPTPPELDAKPLDRPAIICQAEISFGI